MKSFFVLFLTVVVCYAADEVPPYIKQCYQSDPKVLDCYIEALHHLRPWVAKGIPEIELPRVEPFVIDELSLSLTTGPNPYKITLKDLEAYGVSNFTVKRIKLSEGDKPFEATLRIPKLKINAQYVSSGVLLIIPASGGGFLEGEFNGCDIEIRGRVSSKQKDGKTYLHVNSLAIGLDIDQVKMEVKRVVNNNQILLEATNLFLRENGAEVIKAMGPQLTKKLGSLFKNISNKLVTHVPVETFSVPA